MFNGGGVFKSNLLNIRAARRFFFYNETMTVHLFHLEKNAKNEIPREKKQVTHGFFWWSRGVCDNFSADGMFFCEKWEALFGTLQCIKMVLVAHLETTTFEPENWCLEDVCLSFWEAWLPGSRVLSQEFCHGKSFPTKSTPILGRCWMK